MTEIDKLKSRKNPQQFLFYLEKHRIYELFQELSMMLLMKKPNDHVLFLKQSIHHATRRLDVPRIIVLAPPEYEKMELCCQLEKKLNIPLITFDDIAGDDNIMHLVDVKYLVENLRSVVMNFMKKNCDGWILLDFPRNEEDARYLQRTTGIFPSHVIDIVSEDLKCDLSKSREKLSVVSYCKNIGGLRKIFSKYLTTINVKDKQIEHVADEIAHLVKRRKYSRGPTIFRIILIDSLNTARGECLGRQLAEVFNIVHIDFNEILEIISLQDSKLSDCVLDARKKTKNVNFMSPQIKIQVFKEFLSKSEALRKGWILTGYPTTVEDFKNLDMAETPPNRVVIIVDKNHEMNCSEEASEETSEETIENTDCRCGDDSAVNDQNTDECLLSKPNQEPIDEENMKKILEYVGETAGLIKEQKKFKILKEKIEYNLMQPPLCVPPRVPKPPPEIKPEDFQFDPDDEPDTEVFHDIREREPRLTLV